MLTLSPHRLAAAAGRALALSAPLALASLCPADVDVRLIAVSGRPAQGHYAYDYFDSPRINDSNQILFSSRMVINDNSNDECTGAIQIPDGATFIGNIGATSSPGGNHDVWFRYVPTVGGSTVISMTGMNFVPVVGLYAGTCGALMPLSPNGFNAVIGQTYFIRVGTMFSNGVTGTGLLTIRPGEATILTGSTTDDWLWTNRTGTLAPAIQEGAPAAFDPASTYSSLSFPAFSGGGTIALTGATQSSPTQITLATLYTSDPAGNIVPLEIEALTPPPGVARWQLPVPSINNDGRVAYSLLNGTQLRYGAATIASQTQAPGTPSGILFNFFDQPVQAPGAPIAFRATLTQMPPPPPPGLTNDSGLWIDRADGEGVQLLTRAGDAVPGASPSAVFASVAIEPAVNSSAAAAFWASISGSGIDPTNNTGIWTTRAGSLSLLARAGDPAPGAGGAVFSSFSRRITINAAGDIAVLAYITGDGVTPSNNSGIWIYPATGPGALLVRENDQAASLPAGAAYAVLGDPVLNDAGTLAFLARLRGTGVTQDNNQSLFTVPRSAAAASLVRSDDTIAVAPADTRTIREISFGTEAPGSGRASFNNSGTAILQVFFTDLSNAVVTAGISCPADFNHSGTVDSQDYFDFLTAFFASDPIADFNHSGAVDSQDFFDFLTAFFAGCA